MDIHVQHLASLCRICGDEIEDHKRKVLTALFLKFTNLERFNVVGFSKWSSTVKKQSKWCISLLIEHALIIWDKIKTLQVLPQAKKAPDAWSQQVKQHEKNKQEKLIKFELLSILVMMTGSLILVL